MLVTALFWLILALVFRADAPLWMGLLCLFIWFARHGQA